MTSRLVGQTDRFKAALARNGVTDLCVMGDLSTPFRKSLGSHAGAALW